MPQAVHLEPSLGPIIIELYTKHAPKTCRNFLELSKKGYYSGTVFHRIINEFMIQGGDPTGTGRGGTSSESRRKTNLSEEIIEINDCFYLLFLVYGASFEDEISPDLRFTGAGIVAMANSVSNYTYLTHGF